MPIVDIICPICTEVFTNAAEVWSTDCGHLFDLGCMNNWFKREKSCPQCRKGNPTIFKLHVTFDDSAIPQNIEDIQIKVNSSKDKVAELRIQKGELEGNFLKLQEQYTLADASKKDLLIKARHINNAEEEFLRLQAKFTESSETRKQLEDRINQLFIENECKIKELQLKTKENEQLKSSFAAGHVALSHSAQIEKILQMEQKLKFTTAELEREINISTKLSVEKMKLQSYINNISTENKEYKTLRDANNSNSQNKTANKKNPRKNSSQKKQEHNNSVLINEIPLSQLTVPEEGFMSPELRDLFLYAKKMLHNRGFIYFFFQNNEIFTKKHQKDRDVVHIQSKSQVDEMAKIYDLQKLM